MDPRDFAHLILWAIGLYLLLRFFVRPMMAAIKGDAGSSRHCMTCGVDGPPVSRTRGSMGIEILLWLCFIVPGLIYSLWHLPSILAPIGNRLLVDIAKLCYIRVL